VSARLQVAGKDDKGGGRNACFGGGAAMAMALPTLCVCVCVCVCVC
jgi:hypothetical protein